MTRNQAGFLVVTLMWILNLLLDCLKNLAAFQKSEFSWAFLFDMSMCLVFGLIFIYSFPKEATTKKLKPCVHGGYSKHSFMNHMGQMEMCSGSDS